MQGEIIKKRIQNSSNSKKVQKQVSFLEDNKELSMCFTGARRRRISPRNNGIFLNV